jgi:hypothetical protein
MTLEKTQKSEKLKVHIVMNGFHIDRLYLNKKAANVRRRLLLRMNPHYPPTHYSIETHIARGHPK